MELEGCCGLLHPGVSGCCLPCDCALCEDSLRGQKGPLWSPLSPRWWGCLLLSVLWGRDGWLPLAEDGFFKFCLETHLPTAKRGPVSAPTRFLSQLPPHGPCCLATLRTGESHLLQETPGIFQKELRPKCSRKNRKDSLASFPPFPVAHSR